MGAGILKLLYWVGVVQTLYFEITLPMGILLKVVYLTMSLAAFCYVYKEAISKIAPTDAKLEWNLFVAFFLIIVFSVYLVGPLSFRDFNLADPDWKKHNLILHAIYQDPYSPKIAYKGESFYLCYYYAAFLLPALIAKGIIVLFAIQGDEAILKVLEFCYSLYFLLFFVFATLLTFRIAARRMFSHNLPSVGLGLLLFLFFAGMDYWQTALLKGQVFGVHNEWSSVLAVQYSSVMTLIEWVPQHLMTAGLLVLFALLFSGEPLAAARSAIFLLPFSCAASMWVALGYMLFLAGFFFYFWRQVTRRELLYLTMALAITMPIILFYKTKVFAEQNTIRFLIETPFDAVDYLLFLVTEISFPFLIVFFCGRNLLSASGRFLFYFSSITLVILPFFSMGKSNELVMRGGLVFQLILFICCSLVFAHLWFYKRKIFVISFALFSLLLAPQAMNEYVFVAGKIFQTRKESARTRMYKPDDILLRIISRGYR